jgi:hypothetical protein
MGNQKILVPYNFTSLDEKALDFVIQQYGKDQNAEVTLFNAYISVPSLEVSDKTVMQRVGESLSYLRQKIAESEAGIKNAMDRLKEGGFASDKVHYVFKPQEKDVAQEIIDLARKGQFTTVILNRNPRKIARFFTASVSKKVSKALNDLTLYIVT